MAPDFSASNDSIINVDYVFVEEDIECPDVGSPVIVHETSLEGEQS